MELNFDLRARMEHYHVPGVSIATIDDGRLQFVQGFGVLNSQTNRPVEPHSLFNACSISKFFAAMLVIQLASQGIVNLDEDINLKLASWKLSFHPSVQNRKVTLRLLLSHQSGIADPSDSFTELDTAFGSPSMSGLLNGEMPYCRTPVQVNTEPGTVMNYSDAGFCIIELYIEEITGQSFDKLMQELVLDPLKMKDSLYIMSDPSSLNRSISSGHQKTGEPTAPLNPIYPYSAAAGMWTTPTDLSLLATELMNALKGKSAIGITQASAKDFISPQGCSKWAGLGVFLDGLSESIEVTSFGWGVGFQCLLVLYPYKGTGAVIMTNADLGVHQLEGLIGELVKALPL